MFSGPTFWVSEETEGFVSFGFAIDPLCEGFSTSPLGHWGA